MLRKLAQRSFVATVICFLLSPVMALAAFNDVQPSHPYYNSVTWMFQSGYIQGYPDGNFKPDNCVNRAEFLTMVLVADGNGIPREHLYPVPFTDYDETQWYAPAVATAYRIGLIQGYPDGTFRPGNCVNRVEAIKMALIAFTIPPYRTVSDLGWLDINSNEWYYEYFLAAADRNLLGLEHTNRTGSFASYYYPAQGMTRAEVAEMIFRMRTMRDNDLQRFNSLYEPGVNPGAES